MNAKILLFCVFLSPLFLKAQNQEEPDIYVTSDLNLGNYNGVDFNINYVIQKKYVLKAGVSANVRKPVSQPDDYSNGLNGLFSFFTDIPYDHFLNYKLQAGRIYTLNKKGTIRANIAVGLGYTIIKEPANWQYVQSSGWINLTENYTYSYQKHNVISLVINPKIEFPISKYFGFSLGPQLQINKDRTYIGFGIGTMIGKLK